MKESGKVCSGACFCTGDCRKTRVQLEAEREAQQRLNEFYRNMLDSIPINPAFSTAASDQK